MTNKFYTYMLECADKSYYIGITSNLKNRLYLHETGKYGGYTSTRLPVRLVWFQEFETPDEAIKVEKQLKGWTRVKKQALIENDWERISFFAMRRTPNKDTN